jgi:membrane-bound serine protease (ClpP class)
MISGRNLKKPVLVRLVYLSHHRKSITGEEGMIGEEGTAKTDIYNDGKVLVHGEYWSASPERPIPGPVLVVALQEFRAKIEVEQIDTNAA